MAGKAKPRSRRGSKRGSKQGTVIPAQKSTLRIISGQWRGRKIEFFEAEGLRPTGDRVRETLFNWLQESIDGAHCLDLFAGSGALGLEAASRGAALVVMVESHHAAVQQLQKQIARLGADQTTIWRGSALDYINSFQHPFDLIFLDPPFASPLLGQTLAAIAVSNNFKLDTKIYLEYPLRDVPQLPQGWIFQRQKKAGDVGYGLISYHP